MGIREGMTAFLISVVQGILGEFAGSEPETTIEDCALRGLPYRFLISSWATAKVYLSLWSERRYGRTRLRAKSS